MFYNYLKPFNIVCSVFGVRKPAYSNGKIYRISVIHTVWSFIVTSAIIASYCLTVHAPKFDLKENLDQIANMNDLVANTIIMVLHILSGKNITKNLYYFVISILTDLKIQNGVIKLLVQKFYLWFVLISSIFIAAIVLEVFLDHPPYVLLFKIPTYLTIIHLIMHLYLLVATLKVLNYYLDNAAFVNNTLPMVSKKNNKNILKYFLNPKISFLWDPQSENFALLHLCKAYDKMTTCVELLIKLHGLQIFFVVWLTFSNAVVGVTLISCNQVKTPWLAFIKTTLPYFWCYIGAYVGDQMRKQVDATELILIKHLIDFRCDQSRKNTLETFRQLVSTNRLQFTACNLFDMSYSMILGMAMNIVTYSIILIQLFLSD